MQVTLRSVTSPQTLPMIPGIEVVGTHGGKRYLASVSSGGYAQKAVAHKSVLFPIPDAVTDQQALCMLVQGATAWHLLKTMGNIQKGQSVVVHAAAGGVGQILAGWAKALGAFVVGTVGSPAKFAAAKEAGCDAVVVQVPVETKVITKPETVQTLGVLEVSVTVKPESAVGATVSVPVLSSWFAGWL